jgi:hypothetical protein
MRFLVSQEYWLMNKKLSLLEALEIFFRDMYTPVLMVTTSSCKIFPTKVTHVPCCGAVFCIMLA